MDVTLGPEHERLVRERIRRGDFSSPDALIAHALDTLVHRETEETAVRQRLREKIDRGMEQLARGEGLDGEQVFAELIPLG